MKTLTILSAVASLALTIATGHAAPSDKVASKPPARVWWILDFGSGRCVEASKAAGGRMGRTPDAAHKALRADGVADTVDVQKNDDGQIVYVRIAISKDGEETSLFWFPSQGGCATGLELAKAKGLIADDADLQ